MTTDICSPAQQGQVRDSEAAISSGSLAKAPSFARQRTRNVIHSVIQSTTPTDTPDLLPPAEQPTPSANASSSFLYSKTWNIHKTTPLYNFSINLLNDYEAELLAFIAANANNLSSSMLAERTRVGMSTFFNGTRRFPSQIDSSGRNLIDTLDDPGDIKDIKFQLLTLDDDNSQEPDWPRHSLAITIKVRPKGKTREQLYYCALLRNQLHNDSNKHSRSTFTHFNLVLLKAPVIIGQLVMQWLERKFDCRICRLLLQSRDDESSAGLLEGVESHCSDTMKIDFSRLVLTRVGCSSWYIASEGKVKIFPAIADKYSVADFIREIGKHGT
ncbi:hypothetical protein BGZ65_007090 [Modicella reniformis]|uniref:Uncharacterized protein n=1 Tax=Modicella reniformis TaxID=1440133 RepID=A0A9P6IVJ6_9FUNG|nr:hypothetical protein BGZ65_007090 [Modicella reniformis]